MASRFRFRNMRRRLMLAAEPEFSDVLVLGFFDRRNLGDDAFVPAFQAVLPGCRCASIDDLDALPASTRAVVLGGGDVINPYFMRKLRRLVADRPDVRRFAVGVGVPYVADADALLDFEHVFPRSPADVRTAMSVLPAQDVTGIADLTWALPMPVDASAPSPAQAQGGRMGGILAVCPAQPAFAGKDADRLLGRFADALARLTSERGFQIHLLPFNTSNGPTESDLVACSRLRDMLALRGVTNVIYEPDDPELRTHDGMVRRLAAADAALCMRFHSVLFALKACTPFAAVYTTRKIHSLLEEVAFQDYGVRLPVDGKDVPTDVDPDAIVHAVERCMSRPNRLERPMTVDVQAVRAVIASGATTKGARWMEGAYDDSVEDACGRVRQYIATLTGRPADVVDAWFEGTLPMAALWPGSRKPPSNEQLAQTLCFAVTRRLSSPYVWGTVHNLADPAFKPRAAAEWIFHDMREAVRMGGRRCKGAVTRLPPLPFVPSVRGLVDLQYFEQDDFRAFHRSGWSRCIAGLLNLDATVREAYTNDVPLMDVYVDRTFTWACCAMKAAGIIPYRRPWSGFVHHTFDQRSGENNCVALFASPEFRASLPSCRCLFVLSRYLAHQVRAALSMVGHPEVPVVVVSHPMEAVPTVFTMERFLQNKERRVVNIGAWLRDPYAIYDLPLHPQWGNPLGIRKAILRGKDMNSAMEPDWLVGHVCDLAFYRGNDAPCAPGGICRPPGICRPAGPGAALDGSCDSFVVLPAPANTHTAGLARAVQRNHDSVQVLSHLDNDAYDALLADNVVFLKFLDVSAANTVLECVVRHTPLLVNRHPALEEVLGAGYPGYYESPAHAASMLGDVDAIRAMHEHLVALPKDALRLEAFVRSVHDALQELDR